MKKTEVEAFNGRLGGHPRLLQTCLLKRSDGMKATTRPPVEFRRLWEISVFTMTSPIMDVPIVSDGHQVAYCKSTSVFLAIFSLSI